MSYENPSSRHRSRLSTRVRIGVAVVAACFATSPVYSNPLNPTVVNGTATFNQAGSVLTVTNSNGAIINWDKFSIKTGETTHFAQTAASSTVLNRVLNDPTVIYGTLSSNGQVWLVNPAGIMVGPGGLINTAGFVASTLAIRNEDFLAGRHLFINDGSAKNVVNQGEIRTPSGGSVYLIGSSVTNEGIITTPQGETILAAGATVSLIDSATPGVKVDITGAEGNATNLGTITAEAGRIGIAGVIVRNSGTLNASSVVSEGGRIFLKASQDAYVDGNGRIVTTGTKGGSVEVLGNRVAVMDNAVIDASGMNGGGRILVGGDFQGKNPEIQNASITYFGPGATLKADATEVGDGGTVIVWADDTTRAYGSISTRGGATGGNGGFVETSGKNYLAVDGIRVDTRAPQGQVGNWLLDPSDITISNSADNQIDNNLGVFTTSPAYGSSNIYAGTINSQLASTNVIIQTDIGTGGTGDITATGVNIYGGNSLTLAAYGGVAGATGNITITGSTIDVNGGVTMLAGWDGGGFGSGNVISGTGDITIVGSTIQSNSGDINLWAGRDLTLTGGATPTYIGSEYGGGTIDVRVGGNIFLYGGAGSVRIGSLNDSNGSTSVTLSAGKNITSTGNTGGVWLGVGDLMDVYGGSSVTLMAGTDNGFSGNSYGGNIEMVGPGGTYIQTDASGSVSLTAFQVTAANGNITQNAGSIISGGYVSFRADGNLTLNGDTFASNSINAVAGIDSGYSFGYGYNNSPYGGDIFIGGQLQAVGYIEIFALSGGATGMRGNITQVTGSTINGSNIAMGAWGNVDLSGTVSATNNLGVTAGIAIDCGDGCYSSSNASPQGGNITVSGALSGYYGVQLVAEAGSVTGLNGAITQSAGSITAGYGEVRIIGGGNVTLNGSIDGGEGFGSTAVTVQSGYSNSGYTVTPYGGNISIAGTIFGYGDIGLYALRGSSTGANGNAAIGSIYAPIGTVDIQAGGAIYDNNGTALNIIADSISLYSQSGGLAGGLAISMDTSATSSLYSYVESGATFGGISIRNFGSQPGSVFIDDSASSQSNINFYNSSDFTLDGSQTFSSYGSTQIASGGILNVSTSVDGYDINLGGSTINVSYGGSVMADNNVQLLGTTININSGGSIDAGNNVALITPLSGGSINLYGGSVTASGSAATPSYITASNGASLPYTGIAFVAGNLYADYGGSLYAPDTSLGNISGLVTGNITLDNGASFQAGKDVDLVLAGSASMLNLLNGGYILASPTTIKLDFPSRFSGGLNISGGGGLFVGSFGNVATPGAGLVLTYAPIVDNTVTNDIGTAIGGATTDGTPIDPPPAYIPEPEPDPFLSQFDPNATIGGTEDTFGGDDNADKQTDKVKDETKSEKKSQKKYSQCT